MFGLTVLHSNKYQPLSICRYIKYKFEFYKLSIHFVTSQIMSSSWLGWYSEEFHEMLGCWDQNNWVNWTEHAFLMTPIFQTSVKFQTQKLDPIPRHYFAVHYCWESEYSNSYMGSLPCPFVTDFEDKWDHSQLFILFKYCRCKMTKLRYIDWTGIVSQNSVKADKIYLWRSLYYPNCLFAWFFSWITIIHSYFNALGIILH